MSNFLILDAREVKWQEYRELRLEALQKEPSAYGTSYDSQKNKSDEAWQQRFRQYQEGNGNWMIFASDGQQLIGMTGAYQEAEDKKDNSAWVVAVYVKKEFRGKGLGKLLLTTLLDVLAKAEITKAKLGVNVNNIAALTLYKQCSFQTVRTENVLLGDGKYHDEYIMERDLG